MTFVEQIETTDGVNFVRATIDPNSRERGTALVGVRRVILTLRGARGDAAAFVVVVFGRIQQWTVDVLCSSASIDTGNASDGRGGKTRNSGGARSFAILKSMEEVNSTSVKTKLLTSRRDVSKVIAR